VFPAVATDRPRGRPAAAVYAPGTQRSDVTRDDGTRVGLSLDVQDRHQPELCVFSAGPRLLVSRLSRDSRLEQTGDVIGGSSHGSSLCFRDMSVLPFGEVGEASK
jgi:hypothetical protein